MKTCSFLRLVISGKGKKGQKKISLCWNRSKMQIHLLQSSIWNIWFCNDEVLCVLLLLSEWGSLFTLLLFFSTVKGLAHAISTVMCGTSFILPSRRHRAQTMASKRCIYFPLHGSGPKHIILLASSYASSRNKTSFISYFASTTPESEHKRARLKTVLILAGSSLYNTEAIRQQLLESEKTLKFELAIIDGKVWSTAFIVGRL